MQIEQIAVEQLTPYARNSRTHSPKQIEQIAASIREFGFVNPVLIDQSGEIIAGHGRVMAAKHLGLEQVPCLRVEHLTPEQKRAYVIADNRLAELSQWDNQTLFEEIAAIEIPEISSIFADLIAETAAESEKTAAEIRAIEESETNDETADFDSVMADKSTRGKLPIVPQYLESYAAFIIVCKNQIDEAFIRQRLKLNQPAEAYKGSKIRIPNIISVEQLRELIA